MSYTAPRDDIDLEQPRVLLVDDDEVNLMLTAVALRERGFDITEVSSGQEALRLLADWSPDVIVLDAVMPGMDGFTVCRELRSLPGFQAMPVLMLTGLDDDVSITRAYEAGATDFFVKSPQWSLLAGRLRYLLRSSRTRQALERSRAQLARAQDLARMGSFDWHVHKGVLTMSVEGLRVFGLGPGDHMNLRDVLHMVPAEERKGFIAILREVLRHNTVLCTDIPVKLLDGRQRIVHVEAEPEFDEHGNLSIYNGIVQDVTDRRIAEDKIKHLANFDSLTGLPNRRQIIWRAERAIEHAKQLRHEVGLLLIDLDRFKNINDTLGHAAGDELLIEVARRLRACVRHSDQVIDAPLDALGSRAHRTLEAVGRLGGDEFVALLPEVSGEHDAQRVAQRILDALREPVLVGGQECFVTASVGIALFPRDGTTVADLQRNSDVAMYAAKNQGRDALAVYSPDQAGMGREKLELESALHKAIERGELVLHYQPKLDVCTGVVTGVEALMRWQRADRIISPADFIPMAEETGLIVPMSYWALQEAARQVQRWQRSLGMTLPVAVNLPSRMFLRSDLVDSLQAQLAELQAPASCLQLEITETSLMKDLQNVMPSLKRLNQLGLEISIDDFGTGYSSLAYLTTLPIGELKIDRSFIRDLGVRPESAAVVSAIIALARSLRLRVVAEGVESMLQMQELNRLGCSIMQGFLFSRPVPAPEIEEWLHHTVFPRKAPWMNLSLSSEASQTQRMPASQATS
jgi:predicted signal transduction protein with EAL and GGDEF domain/FixJ family two-component response regulator